MGVVIALVFVGVFATATLLMVASGSSRNAKQVQATLDSALGVEMRKPGEQIVSILKDARLSSIPWLNQRLHELEVAPHLDRLLKQANISWTAGKLMLVIGTCFALPFYLVYLHFGMLLIALGVGLAGGAVPLAWVMMKRNKRFDKFQEVLPEALDLTVSALRAGHSLIAAMGLVARECTEPVAGEFKICFDEQNYGLELKVALDNLVYRVPLQDLKIVTTAILIQKESGGNLAEVLDKTAHVIRERFRLKRQVKVHTAQGRMTGWVLTALPMVLGCALYFLNPQMTSILWHRAIGIKLLWGAAGMTVVGGFIINRIVNMEV